MTGKKNADKDTSDLMSNEEQKWSEIAASMLRYMEHTFGAYSDLYENEIEDDSFDCCLGKLLSYLERIARDERPLISKSMDEHFERIVQIMHFVGAERHGSGALDSDGRKCMVDFYTLQSGAMIKAGYERLSDAELKRLMKE